MLHFRGVNIRKMAAVWLFITGNHSDLSVKGFIREDDRRREAGSIVAEW